MTALSHDVSHIRKGLSFMFYLLGLISIIGYCVEVYRNRNVTQHFSEATNSAYAGRWFWDRTNEKSGLYWDAQMHKIYGTSPETGWTPDFNGWARMIAPEDHDWVVARCLNAANTRTSYQAVFRIKPGKNGLTRVVLAGGFSSPDGKYMTGINVPISGQIIQDLDKIFHSAPHLEDPSIKGFDFSH